MIYYLWITLSAVLMAAYIACANRYQKVAGTGPKSVLVFNIIMSGFSAVLFFIMNGFCVDVTPFSALMALAMAAVCVCYTLVGFQILKLGGMTLYSLFLMTGGMIVPSVWGVIFWQETPSAASVIGIVLITLAVALSKSGDGKKSGKILALCMAVFLLNGFSAVISKAHQMETAHAIVSSPGFIILVDFARIVLCALVLAVYGRPQEKNQPGVKTIVTTKAVWVVMPLVAITDGLAYFLQIISAKHLPASALYPFVTGGSIVFSTVTGYLLFKEKPDRRLTISVVLCFLGTVLFLF